MPICVTTLLSKLKSMAVIDQENALYRRAVTNTRKDEQELLRDEIICITLLGLSHMKDTKSKYDTLSSVHIAINNWVGDDTKRRSEMDSLLKNNTILCHAITVLRDISSDYNPNTIVADEELKFDKKGRCISALNTAKDANADATRQALGVLGSATSTTCSKRGASQKKNSHPL